MGNKIVDDSVIEELTQLSRQFHELCAENDIPSVICFSCGTHNDGPEYCRVKLLAVNLDKENDAFDETILAAHMFLDKKSIPERALPVIFTMAECFGVPRERNECQMH